MSIAHRHVIGYTAAFLLATVVSAGTATAAQHLHIMSADIVNGQVKTVDLGDSSVTSAKIARNTVTGADINESTLATVPNAAKLGGINPVGIARALRVIFNVGTATTLKPRECAAVFGFGVGADTDAGKIVTGYIVDVNGDRVPSLNNATVFLPGTVFKTSQGGTIGFFEVCNPTAQGKDLPQGWKAITTTK
jgi:hypothetical protein